MAAAGDSDGNTTTSAGITVTVANGSPGLVAAYGFDETTWTIRGRRIRGQVNAGVIMV